MAEIRVCFTAFDKKMSIFLYLCERFEIMQTMKEFIIMYKTIFNTCPRMVFKHFTNKGYALFACLGKEVLIGTLSVASLTYAKAEGMSNDSVVIDTIAKKAMKEYSLAGVEVTASKAPLMRNQQARMVTVLTQKDVNAAPVQSVNDLLKHVVSVDVRQRSPLGAQTDIGIRGGNSEQTALLFNGIPVGNPHTAHNAFDFPIGKHELTRIEVLEGPAGSVYGTASLLGAIHLVSVPPLASSATVYASGGSFGYGEMGGRVNLVRGAWNQQVSASYVRSDGYQRNKQGGLNTDYRGVKALYQGYYDTDALLLQWHAGLSNRRFGSSTNYSAKYDDQFEHTLNSYTALQAATKRGFLKLRSSVYWNRFYDRFELFRGRSDRYPFNYHRTNVVGASVNSYFDTALGRTAFGAEWQREMLVSTNLGTPLSAPKSIHGVTGATYKMGCFRTNVQLFAEHNLTLDRFSASLGLVGVKNSHADMGLRFYPNVNLSYRLGQAWQLYLSFNSSLRMPSITELFYSVGGHKANPNLRPEELTAWELGAKYEANGVAARAHLFYNRYTHLIDWINSGETDASGSLLWRSVNFGKIKALGVETNVIFDFKQLLPAQQVLQQLQLGYCFIQQNQHEPAGIRSRYALEYLKQKFVAAAQFHVVSQLNLQLNYRFQHRMGQYLDASGTTHRYGSYGLLDAKFLWQAPRWQAYVEGNNLLNRHYFDVGNVPQPGCWVVAGAAFNIQL